MDIPVFISQTEIVKPPFLLDNGMWRRSFLAESSNPWNVSLFSSKQQSKCCKTSWVLPLLLLLLLGSSSAVDIILHLEEDLIYGQRMKKWFLSTKCIQLLVDEDPVFLVESPILLHMPRSKTSKSPFRSLKSFIFLGWTSNPAPSLPREWSEAPWKQRSEGDPHLAERFQHGEVDEKHTAIACYSYFCCTCWVYIFNQNGGMFVIWWRTQAHVGLKMTHPQLANFNKSKCRFDPKKECN